MKLQHIKIDDLKTTAINVRKKGGKDIADLLPSIRSLGILQPLLVRPNCEGYEIVAGQRRYHALVKLSEESEIEPVPCIIMDEQDNAKAIEASLAENVARLPMDEIDQYKAFSALVKEGKSVDEIASQFGITERLVEQRLAIANLINPVLTAYRKDEIGAGTIRSLTLATKRQQNEWWKLFKSEDEYAPQGHALKEWLFGGANIPVSNAMFDVEDYKGAIVSDLFGDERYFADTVKFWSIQNQAIAEAKERYLANGWSDVILLDVGDYWSSWEYCKTAKKDGGKVYVRIANDGEVTFHEGYLTEKEAKRLEKASNGTEPEKPVERCELTKSMQNYLDLHRHSAVRTELLAHGDIALRLAVAQIIAGSSLWDIKADQQKANTDAIAESLATNKAEDRFTEERQAVRDLLGWSDDGADTIVPAKNDWQRQNDLYKIFAKLIELDDVNVTRILTFVVAETLPAGSAMVEVLGNLLNVDMADHWQVNETPTQSVFLDLHRDKEAINAMLKHIGGKHVADGNISATAKVQKKIIADFLDGTRKGGKKANNGNWQPRYMDFPMRAYTKRGGIATIESWKAVKKHYI
ncbi:MAG: ParB/RepB/Spo0J family partition protein [Hyphomicrobiales bacterium]|nr:ParB/RepB/Spo0J family partition protein [Hyphomicrobiales bacterium]